MRKFRYRKEVMADINMTNLIDIVMVLLIIFILVANFVQTGLDIEIPQVSYVEQTGKERILIGLDSEGEITINRQPVAEDELPARLTELKEEFPDEAVFVKADKEATVGAMMTITAAAREAGFTKVNVPLELFRGRGAGN